MPNHEQDDPVEALVPTRAVWELKSAQSTLLVRPLTWESEDGEFQYYAEPLEVQGEEPVDLTTLPDMPMWQFLQVLPTWDVVRVSLPDINGEVAVDQYLVSHLFPLHHTSHLLPPEVIDEGEERMTEEIYKNHVMQTELGLDAAEPEDYEAIDQAIADLKVVSHAALMEKIERRRNMTEDERRWERMQKFAWLVPAEMDRNQGPRWWGISEGSHAWAVYCATPDEAVIMIEDSRDGAPIFPLVYADEYPEATQAEFSEKLAGREVVRLIPFSDEPWPEEPDNMTDAQKTAFDKLKDW